MGVLLCKLPIFLTQKKKIYEKAVLLKHFRNSVSFPFTKHDHKKCLQGAPIEVFNVRRRNQMSMKLPLPEGKESQGKHMNEEDSRPHRLTGIQISMTSSNWKHHVLEPVTFSIHFVASPCTAFPLHTGHAELLLRFLLNPHNLFFAIRIQTAAGSEALSYHCIHSRHQQHPGPLTQFQIPKNYLLESS